MYVPQSLRLLQRTFRVVFLAGCAAAVLCGSASGQDPESRFAAHLSAGEFGPAIQIAQSLPDSQRRDALLGRVASAQWQSGARHASTSSAALIRNDQLRNAAFESLAGPGSFARGAGGGAALADFDTLIELIQSTIAPESWVDAGGVGAIESFPTGVLVDAAGTVRRGVARGDGEPLARIRRSALSISGNRNVRQSSPLRKVSLIRLERQAQRLWALGQRPEEAMRRLAGMTRVRYVLVYPQSRDIVLAGPAGDWDVDPEGRPVSLDTREPVLQLDDLVVVLRRELVNPAPFGCAITPRRGNLSSVQQFLQESAGRSLAPHERGAWLDELRRRLGPQDIEVFGVDPATRLARILVEADYRMKLVGMGLEPGTLGVPSYLESVRLSPGGSLPPMEVLRWWFTMNYEAPRTTSERDAFELVGKGVQVQCENEVLAERGERVHTGEASPLNRQFADNFTRHFADLAVKYPVYAELRNIFDLALVAAIIRSEDLTRRCDWEPTFFGAQGKYEVEREVAPRQVDSILNHRVIDRRHLVVGVSGGVQANAARTLQAVSLRTDPYGLLSAERAGAAPPHLPPDAWWWD